MENYSKKEKIGNRINLIIGAGTIPSLTSIITFMNNATKIINSEVRASSNMTDIYGELEPLEIDLVLKMIRNMWSYSNPDDFPYEEVILSADQKRIIHRCHSVSRGHSWELGG